MQFIQRSPRRRISGDFPIYSFDNELVYAGELGAVGVWGDVDFAEEGGEGFFVFFCLGEMG